MLYNISEILHRAGILRVNIDGQTSFNSVVRQIYRPEEFIQLEWKCTNSNMKFLQLWNAGHDACLTVECRAGKASINL